MAARLDHLTVTASNFPVSLGFYDAALGALGLLRVAELGGEEEDDAQVEAVAFGTAVSATAASAGVASAGVLWLVGGSVPSRGLHVAFRAEHRDEVMRFHAAGLVHGGVDHSAPRRWPIYRRGEFNAILRDPDGNLIEAISRE